MKRAIPPIEAIRITAKRLEGLCEEVAFLGGAVVGFLVTDPASREPRPTEDVDVTIEVTSKTEYDVLEDRLRKLGFRNVIEGPIFRFQHGEIILDVMPTSADVLGFGDIWYPQALAESKWVDLGESIRGRIVTATYFIATKLAAFAVPDREGSGDYLSSRDFEDIVTVLDGRPEIVAEVGDAESEVRSYIAKQMARHLDAEDIDEGIAAHLDIDTASRRRAAQVRARMQELAAL